MYRVHMHLDLGWDHLIWAREQAITEGSLKQNPYINVWLLSLASGALDSKHVQKSQLCGRANTWILSFHFAHYRFVWFHSHGSNIYKG